MALSIFINLFHQASFLNLNNVTEKALRERYPRQDIRVFTEPELMVAQIADADYVITWHFEKEWYTRAHRLRAVITPAAGKDLADEDPSGRVPLYNCHFHGRMMAQSLVAMILYFSNRFHLTLVNQRCHFWDRNAQFPMHLLDRQRVLIAGYGHIGRHAARLLAPLGCSIVGLQRTHKGGVDPQTGARFTTPDHLREELKAADHVVLLLPNTPDTRGLFDSTLFSCMKPSAFFYNQGRGAVVIEDDLVASLQNGTIAGAGLDVFEREPLPPSSPLWSLQNVILTPHTSAGYEEYGELFVEELLQQLGSLESGAQHLRE
jgi:D-2-hydroxyacid dehydrogenase (NADP+)